MIGWTLGRYIFRRYLIAVSYFMAGLASLIFIIDFTQLNGRVAQVKGYTTLVGLSLSAMRLPFVLLQIVPFVALFGSMAMLVQLNRKYELVIARSAGLSADLVVAGIHQVDAAAVVLEVQQHPLAERTGARGGADDGDAGGVEHACQLVVPVQAS